MTRSAVVSDDFVGDDEEPSETGTSDGGIKLHLAARVDGEAKHPLGATVTERETHESPQFERLTDDIEVFEDLDSPIWVFDRGICSTCGFAMQPHAPYLGPSGKNISYTKGQLHRVVKDNSISKSAIRSAYYENLEIVLESIKPIIKKGYGKTVISADHGEMLGESLVGKIEFLSYYGHPYGLQKDCVRSVPWHIIDYDVENRRDINESNAYSIDSEDVTEQLQALGYL